ncbi:hypothetical protein AAG570_012374 [Ranatra chinensis]|uniref:MD-2-related lipid-recognition domain-containing protein n=1 Tax=Ranatra chinensis TaxID=642074 RepID=A0ABD0YX22_9HEMI
MSRALIALLFLSVLAVAPLADAQVTGLQPRLKRQWPRNMLSELCVNQVIANLPRVCLGKSVVMVLLPYFIRVNAYIRSIGSSYVAQGTITVNQVIPADTIITSAIVRLTGTTLGLQIPIQVNLCTFLNSTGFIYSLNSSVPITCPIQPGTYGVRYTLPIVSALQTRLRTALQLPLLLLGSTLSCIQTVLILQSGNVTAPTPPIFIQPATGLLGCILPRLLIG